MKGVIDARVQKRIHVINRLLDEEKERIQSQLSGTALSSEAHQSPEQRRRTHPKFIIEAMKDAEEANLMDESDPLMINLLSSKASRESALTPSEMPTNIKIVSGQKNRQLNKGRNDEPYL